MEASVLYDAAGESLYDILIQAFKVLQRFKKRAGHSWSRIDRWIPR